MNKNKFSPIFIVFGVIGVVGLAFMVGYDNTVQTPKLLFRVGGLSTPVYTYSKPNSLWTKLLMMPFVMAQLLLIWQAITGTYSKFREWCLAVCLPLFLLLVLAIALIKPFGGAEKVVMMTTIGYFLIVGLSKPKKEMLAK